MLRFSVNQATTPTWLMDEDAVFYSSCAFDGIGLLPMKVTDFGEEKTRSILEDFGLQVSSFGMIGGFTGGHGRWHDATTWTKESLVTANTVGANNIILYPGCKNGHIRSQAMRCLISGIEQLLPFAEEFGMRLLLGPELETVSRNWNFLYDWNSVFDVVDRFPKELVGIVLNTYHASFLREIVDVLPARIDQIGLVQISDGKNLPQMGKKRDFCLLGDGILNPEHWIELLQKNQYHGWVEMELSGTCEQEIGYNHRLSSCQIFADRIAQSVTDPVAISSS